MPIRELFINGDQIFNEIDEVYQQTELDPDPVMSGGMEAVFLDDYDARLQQIAESRFGPEGQPLDDLTAKAQDQQIQRDAARDLAPPVSINPASAYHGLLGGQATVYPLTDGAGNYVQTSTEVARWTGRDTEACPVSIALDPLPANVAPLYTGQTGVIPPPAPPAVNPIIRPFARIQFGTRDGLVKVEVDIGSGTQIVVPASNVYVEVGLDAGSNTEFRMSSSLAFSTVLRTLPTTRTVYIDAQATDSNPANSFQILRPARAIELVGFERVDPAAAYTLYFLGVDNNVSNPLYVRTIAANAILTAPIFLSNDVYYIWVSKTAGAGTSNARVIFGLEF